MKGIKVELKDGSVDHFDPCDSIQIYNGLNLYTIKVSDIKHIEEYETEDTEVEYYRKSLEKDALREIYAEEDAQAQKGGS